MAKKKFELLAALLFISIIPWGAKADGIPGFSPNNSPAPIVPSSGAFECQGCVPEALRVVQPMSLKCPDEQTDELLQVWRSAAIQNAVNGKYGDVGQALKDCFPSGAPRCMKNLESFIETKKNPELRDKLKSTDPFANRFVRRYEGVKVEQEGLTLRSEKDLPKEFTSDSKPGTVVFPPDILQLAKDKGWRAIAYKTRSTGGFDGSPNLVLVAIPGRDKDVYLQISPRADHDKNLTKDNPYPESDVNLSKGQNVLTIITVDKTKWPPEGQLRLLTATGDISRHGIDADNGSFKWSNKLSSQTCIGCHITPLRSISPRGYLTTNGTEKRMTPEDESTVQKINEMMLVEGLSWGKVKVDGHEVQRGPAPESQPYGWAPRGSPTRQPDFLNQCAFSTASISYKSFDTDIAYNFSASGDHSHLDTRNLSRAMNCVQCHNSKIRGYLHGEFSTDEIKFKVLVDKSMPPGVQLSDNDRIALFNCLIAERDENAAAWKAQASWAQAEACETASIGRPNPYPRTRTKQSGTTDTTH